MHFHRLLPSLVFSLRLNLTPFQLSRPGSFPNVHGECCKEFFGRNSSVRVSRPMDTTVHGFKVHLLNGFKQAQLGRIFFKNNSINYKINATAQQATAAAEDVPTRKSGIFVDVILIFDSAPSR
ncbi:hypothetical protein M378DRAFT_907674 [Amanita muscaria Koide BX008]|uniref:Uncharacterized protein n=1 Tax=Amanita muscaria (strain Koide BX008) TaxID=946122 RepID=A0A0C2WWQ7_AMAMK|nr:hypothetical protein M378DRAFT_907674 [Amanita muscaria Koide BX008]